MPKIHNATVQFNANNCMLGLPKSHPWSFNCTPLSFLVCLFIPLVISVIGVQQLQQRRRAETRGRKASNEPHKFPDRIYQILGPLFRTRPRSQWTDLKSKRKQQEKCQCKELCSRGCVHYNFPQIFPFDLINFFEVQRKKIRNQQSSLSH